MKKQPDKPEPKPDTEIPTWVLLSTLIHPALGVSLFFAGALREAWVEANKPEPINWEERYYAEKERADMLAFKAEADKPDKWESRIKTVDFTKGQQI